MYIQWIRVGHITTLCSLLHFVVFTLPQPQHLLLHGWPIGSIGDYFGLPTVGQVTAGKSFMHSALPLRAYNLIFNGWFRDQNLVPSLVVNTGDGPDSSLNYAILHRGS